MIEMNTILPVDAIEGLRMLPDRCVQCCVTSPPYWSLRDYGVHGQIGMEQSPEAFVERLCNVFEEVKRVLTHDGVLWLNLGDAYWGVDKSGDSPKRQFGEVRHNWSCSGAPTKGRHVSLKPKDLIGLPWMVAFALRQPNCQCLTCLGIKSLSQWGILSGTKLICPTCGQACGYRVACNGWYLRQDIIWHKPNPMPESVTDRCTKAHEYIFLLSKSERYYFDHQAIREPIKGATVRRLLQDIESQKGSDRVPGKANGNMKAVGPHPNRPVEPKENNEGKGAIQMARDGSSFRGGHFTRAGELLGSGMANKRSVWVYPTHSAPGSIHYATYPEGLIVDCIKAGSRPGDIILDPFAGSGTTPVVAACLGRKYIAFDLNPKYVDMARARVKERMGLFYQGP